MLLHLSDRRVISGQHQSKRILVVEDDFSIEPVMNLIVQEIGGDIQIDWVATAQAANKMIERGSYDLLISDVFLDEETTGLELLAACKTRAPAFPVLLMTGMSTRKLLESMKTHRIHAPILQKPLNPALASEQIRYALGLK